MVRRYAYLAAEHLAGYTEKMEGPSTETYGTNTAQPSDLRDTVRLKVI